MKRAGKNATRLAPPSFPGPLTLIEYDDGKFGHLVAEDVDGGVVEILPPLHAAPISVPASDVRARHGTVPPPPPCMLVVEEDEENEDDVKFYDFSPVYGIPSCVFVAVPDTADVIDVVARALVPDLKGPDTTITVSDSCRGFKPWAGFRPRSCDTVVCVELGMNEEVVQTAHRLAARGFLVAGPAGKDQKPRTLRVKPTLLKWIRDADELVDLALIVDTDMENVPVYSPSNCSVPRTMLCWGRFAAVVSKTLTDVPVSALAEPLASYVTAVKTFKTKRTCVELTFNTAPKATPEQVTQSLDLFYWAAVHRDEDTRAFSKAAATAGLNMYLALGHVCVEKRPYKFHDPAKRSRKPVK